MESRIPDTEVPFGDAGGNGLLRSLADSLELGVLACDPHGRVVHANAAFCRLAGVGLPGAIGRLPEELPPFHVCGEISGRIAEVRASGEPFAQVCALSTASGSRRCRVQVVPAGAGAGTLVLVTDVGPTATHGERQAVLDFALDRVDEFVYLLDEEGRILYANDAACRSVGYSRAELLNMTVFDITPEFATRRWAEHWASVAAAGSRVIESLHRGRDGHVFPVEVRINHFSHEGRGYHLTLVADISERRRAQELEDHYREFLTLAEGLPDNIVRYDRNGRATYVNAQLEATLGRPRVELLGTRPTDLNPPGVPLFDTYDAGVMNAISTGEPQSVELDFPGPRGHEYHQVRIIAERDDDGTVIGAIALGRDVTERHRHLQQIDEARREAEQHARELAVARDEAVRAARVKSEFLANMSHEIRTPMNGVLGLADLLLAGELNPAAREMAEGIHRSGVALLTIINDILDFSKLEAGRMTLAEEPFDLLTLCNDVIALLSARASQRRLVLRLEFAESVPLHWRGDAGRIRQILLNLLGNAIKFTPSGEVVLSVRPSAEPTGALVLEVRDTGIGIPSDRLEAVFDSFTQADGSITRRFGGTGLGLAITRQLVDLMHGTVRAQSEPGQGSTFTCELPLSPLDARTTVAPPAPVEPAVDLPPLELDVLLVEDNAVNRMVATRLLRGWKCGQTVAEDGAEALERMKSGGFDVVLMDVQMPVMDGLTASEHWREIERERGGHVPIIALTAHAMEGDRERCMEAGMDDYVSKPLRPAELHAAIVRAHARLRRADGPDERAA